MTFAFTFTLPVRFSLRFFLPFDLYLELHLAGGAHGFGETACLAGGPGRSLLDQSLAAQHQGAGLRHDDGQDRRAFALVAL
jgi:hypothetical protein